MKKAIETCVVDETYDIQILSKGICGENVFCTFTIFVKRGGKEAGAKEVDLKDFPEESKGKLEELLKEILYNTASEKKFPCNGKFTLILSDALCCAEISTKST